VLPSQSGGNWRSLIAARATETACGFRLGGLGEEETDPETGQEVGATVGEGAKSCLMRLRALQLPGLRLVGAHEQLVEATLRNEEDLRPPP